ncbi:MAG: DUF2520 domain-containing protein [Bacteroidia bacterium]|nr:DUF2520 domain-containing protein [Bacteroidia bacterium]MDW8088482.1 DUF2520 domain-containing protein [Bacteroidia bacterium]
MWLIIGAGGVGRALAQRLHELAQAVGLVGRPYQNLAEAFPTWTDWREAPLNQARAIILAVRDQQIPSLAAALKGQLSAYVPVAHTAGSVPLAVLQDFFADQAGVLYPLQSFTPAFPISWGTFPIFWEGHPIFEELALVLAGHSQWVQPASSEERLRLHIGAVFAANFLNALLEMASRLSAPKWDHRVFLPLASQVLQKLYALTPLESQTGPARRGDTSTLLRHQSYLQQHLPDLAPLYQAFTAYIQKHLVQSSRQ